IIECRLAQAPVGFLILGIETYGNAVNKSLQFRKNVPFVNKVTMAVCIYPHLSPLLLHTCSNCLDSIEPEERFTIPAKDNFPVPGGIADSIHQVLNRRLMRQSQIVPFHNVRSIANAKNTFAGASVGNI